ncbi:hypothetical protein K501DRAFT_331141 [Backusella circina FSU 941]|nr:hypothetical protein K501DRAFT_331141 [Backusella circina FSU 941]
METFSEKYQSFLENCKSSESPFTNACFAFTAFEEAKLQTSRLFILYILYAQYAHVPLRCNPFLTFFLELLESDIAIEQHFVYCILEETIDKLDLITPQQVCNDPTSTLPSVEKNKNLIDTLKLHVARLIDNPDIQVINDQVSTLLNLACTRTLTLSENQTLRKEFTQSPNLDCTCISPVQLPTFIDLNPYVASFICPNLLTHSAYLEALLNTVTIQSLELMHHILTQNACVISQEFLHAYISQSIKSCEMVDTTKESKQVKQVAKFIHSLLEHGIIEMDHYIIEIQAFCTSFMRYKAVTLKKNIETIFRTKLIVHLSCTFVVEARGSPDPVSVKLVVHESISISRYSVMLCFFLSN